MLVSFCEVILPNFQEVESLLQLSKQKQISNFGPLYWRFKEELEEYFGLDADHTVTIVSSGHVALMAALHAAKATSCVVPGYTFSSTFQAAFLQGMKPIIVDVDTVTGVPNFESLWQQRKNFNTILLVCPLSIVPPNIEEFITFSKELNCHLIIDGAATFGTKGIPFNQLDLYCMSFHATKTFPLGEGGCIIHHKKYTEAIRSYICFGMDTDKKIVSGGLNGKVSDYTCAIGLSLLHIINPLLQKRRENTEFLLKNLSCKHLPSLPETVYSCFPCYLDSPASSDQAISSLKDVGIEAFHYYRPLEYSLPLNNSLELYHTSVCVPCHSSVSKENLEKMIEIISLEG